MKHLTVLKKQTVDLLNVKDGGVYLDLTLGGGGHSLEILERAKNVTLISFDIDKKNIDEFKQVASSKWQVASKNISEKIEDLAFDTYHLILINDNFAKLDEYLEELNIDHVDGIIADLGWSSDQLENITGLSYENKSDELDMRMNSEYGVRASDLLNGLGKRELSEMFEKYADIHGGSNNRLVEEIKKFRNKRLFETVGDYIDVINKAYDMQSVERGKKGNKLQIYSRAFQALRIAVNSEFSNLKDALQKGFNALSNEGVISIITFHSGEERLVKDFVNKNKDQVEIVSRERGEDYLRPTVNELLENMRARSAKLIGIKKVSK
jgi:16S rRNA (cytosine1402-N4)-methyltransferase